MSTANRDTLPENFQPAKRSMGMTCLIGCLGMLFVMVLVCGGLGIGAYYYGPGLFAGQMREVIVQTINESEMNPADKQEVIAQVDRVVNAYKAGEINNEQLVNVLQKLMESPVMGIVMVYAANEQYVKPSGLSEEEKQAAHLVLERVARGVVEEKISHESLDDAMSIIQEESSDDSPKFKDKITDEELRQFIAAMKKHADDAQIPEEPYQVSIGQEVKKAVDKALAGEHGHDHAEVEP